MKKVFLVFGALSLMLVASCKNKETTTETDTTVVHDTIVAEPTDVPPPPPPPVEATQTDGTSVSVNSDGVSVDTKNGTKSTKVEVENGGGTVQVKK